MILIISTPDAVCAWWNRNNELNQNSNGLQVWKWYPKNIQLTGSMFLFSDLTIKCFDIINRFAWLILTKEFK